MSPKQAPGAPTGSGPHGRVQIGDIQAKLEEIRGDTTEAAEQAKPVAVIAGIAGVVLLVGVAFYLGRRRGRRTSTWVEIRRL